MNNLPSHLKDFQCTYCSHSLDEESWKSIWSWGKHYKSQDCSGCGEENWFEANFHGSGHEGDVRKVHTGLESTVNRVAEK
ncbi:MAG: hypothetical protein Q8Q01_02420 [archaeon]|nr:hypothetical protein [archaeon]